MQEVINKQTKQKSYTLFAFALVLGVLGLISFVFHVSPNVILERLSEFSKHHFLSTAVLLLVAAVVLLKVADGLYPSANAPSSQGASARQIMQRKMRAVARNLRFAFKSKSSDNSFKHVPSLNLHSIKFCKDEVLPDAIDQIKRQSIIEHALKLGKLYRQKVVICFRSETDNLYTIAGLTAVFETYILLNNGAKIPINAILKLEL